MAMKKIEWNREFPEVPDEVHDSVLHALSKLERQEEPKMQKRIRKKHILLLAAAMTALLGTTAAASGLFSWNDRAKEVFQADEEAQNMLTMEQMAQEVSTDVTDQGITIRAIQTIQDKNCFYALFEVTAEDTDRKITSDQDMEYTIDFKGKEDPFVYIGWGFVSAEAQEVTNSRYFEIYGTKADSSPEELAMGIHFSALLDEPDEKAGIGKTLVEGNWDFDLTVHESESIRYDLGKEYQISGYSVNVQSVEISPLSFTIFYEGGSVKAMEEGEQVNLDQLDDLPALYPTGVRYEDGTELEEQCHPMLEGYTDESKSSYQVTMQFTEVVDAQQVKAFLMGEDEITF